MCILFIVLMLSVVLGLQLLIMHAYNVIALNHDASVKEQLCDPKAGDKPKRGPSRFAPCPFITAQ